MTVDLDPGRYLGVSEIFADRTHRVLTVN